MPSKRKAKLREERLFRERGWFAISEDMWKEPGEKSSKLRFVSDVNFSSPLADQIRARGAEVRSAQELGFGTLADAELLSRVSAMGYVLITMDSDFWSERKIPLRSCGGLVLVEGASPAYAKSDGFELLMVILESLGGVGRRKKVKSTATQLYLKGIGEGGQEFFYEIRAIRPLVYAREVEPSGSQ